MNMTKIEILSRPTKNDLEDVNALLPQLAKRPHFMNIGEFKRIAGQKACRLAVARREIGTRSMIVGMATLTLVYIPTGLIAVIEDVVVDGNFRRLGIGKKLTQKLINIASKLKAKHISLSTNPARLAANAMYKKMGFLKKETNCYRINLYLPKPASQREIKKMIAKRKFLSR